MAQQSLDFASERIKPTTKLIGLCILAMILLVTDNRLSVVQHAKSALLTALYPLQWVANKPVEMYQSTRTFFSSQAQLQQQNQALTQENLRLQAELSQKNSQLRPAQELQALHQLQQSSIRSVALAEVASIGRDPLSGKVIINRGSHAGVTLGQAVVDANGLLGQVTSVQQFNAQVTLLTYNQAVIPVMVARTGVRTLLYGNAQRLDLRYFPSDADLRPNDILVTSGLDDVFPAGIPVAKVMTTEKAVGTPYYRAQTAPVAALDSMRYVLVLPLNPSVQPAATTPSVASTPAKTPAP